MSLSLPPHSIYHLYNQGNNKQVIFLDELDYTMFLRFYKKYAAPFCDLFAWCLMPNHYHFMLMVNDSGGEVIKVGTLELSRFSNGIRLLQSKYCQYFNTRHKHLGSLFRPKAKMKCCDVMPDDYATYLFHYIHSNPVDAGLVIDAADWQFSSYRDYYCQRGGKLINTEKSYHHLGIELETEFVYH